MLLVSYIDTKYQDLGASGIGELIANTLAVRNVTVVVLDINPIVSENCKILHCVQPLLQVLIHLG